MDMKFVLDLKEHSVLTDEFLKRKQRMKSFEEQAEFIRRSKENLQKEAEKYEEDFWLRIVDYAKSKNILEADLKAEDSCFHFNEKYNQIFMHDAKDHEQNPFEMIISMLGKEPR